MISHYNRYAVSAYCRFDDNGAFAGNEWSGAWTHTNPIQGSYGTYIFEMSRDLTTESDITDVQLEAGFTYGFGFGFWDPHEGESGWTDAGHFVTGCSKDWIDITLAKEQSSAMSMKVSVLFLVVAPIAAALFL